MLVGNTKRYTLQFDRLDTTGSQIFDYFPHDANIDVFSRGAQCFIES